MEKIDFVIAWVDGNDEEWQKQKREYSPSTNNDDTVVRYRDWDILQYWFRGVEKFAPWVNNVYFLTWGHYPKWLNINNPKLKIINHQDYIPSEYLPTFNSHTIELNIHRIEGLSDKFVYFNDDMFIIDNVKETDFFKNNLPCDSAVFSPYIPKSYNDLNFICWNMIGVINSYFDKNKVVKNNFFKYYNLKYGTKLIRSLFMTPWPNYTGFFETHLPNSYLKKTLIDVWKNEYDLLNNTSIEKFRNLKTHVNQWVFRYWQLADAKFYPRSLNFGKYLDLTTDFDLAIETIKKRTNKVVCLNDTTEIDDFDEKKQRLNKAFELILEEKSSFEI